ncbi:chaplin family protein [Streptomyces sp. KLMMK]|uniref:chaplin family protein n=1 Tax=Streptomyces sp. KLMMK TaxID=3109353 RepID=UPI002FFDC087
MTGFRTIVITAGALTALALGSTTTASADTTLGLEGGVLGGTQVTIPMAVPINVCGNNVAGLGAPCVHGSPPAGEAAGQDD